MENQNIGLLVTNPHFDILLAGAKVAYEVEMPGSGGNPLISRSHIITGGTVRLAFPEGTTFTRVEANTNAPAHSWAEIDGIRVILPDGVTPWTGEKVVTLQLRVNTVEPKNVTRRAYRNYRLVLDEVRPSTEKPAGAITIEAAKDRNATVIRDGLMIHGGGCIKFPPTGTIPNTAARPQRRDDRTQSGDRW